MQDQFTAGLSYAHASLAIPMQAYLKPQTLLLLLTVALMRKAVTC